MLDLLSAHDHANANQKLMTRSRKNNALRPVTIDLNATMHAEGSCLIKMGNTHVLCTTSVEEKVPPFLRGQGQGWLTAEYGMLPRSTHTRIDREAVRGKQQGRTQEIQRLIGRSLRTVLNFKLLGERTLKVDCDVLQADGGTRTASITGAYVAVYLACQKLQKKGKIRELPITDSVAAVSCGLCNNTPVLDLDYNEDSSAETDANFVLTGKGKIIEVQATAEKEAMSEEQLLQMLNLAKEGIKELTHLQTKALFSNL